MARARAFNSFSRQWTESAWQSSAISCIGRVEIPCTTCRQPWVELLSWKPRAYLYHNFLSPEVG